MKLDNRLNAMTVDVEDYFQVSAFEGVVEKKDWDSISLRVGDNTHRLLDLFAANNVKSTFKNFKFILVDAKSKTRYSRIRKRDRIGDPTSYTAFRDQEKNEFKLYKNFDETLKQVDFVIDNNSTLEDLYKNVDSIMSKV